jgi:hypothetical protein
MLEPDGGGAPDAPFSGWNRRGLAAACVNQSRPSGSIGSLALFRRRAWGSSAHEHERMGRPSGECQFHIRSYCEGVPCFV